MLLVDRILLASSVSLAGWGARLSRGRPVHLGSVAHRRLTTSRLYPGRCSERPCRAVLPNNFAGVTGTIHQDSTPVHRGRQVVRAHRGQDAACESVGTEGSRASRPRATTSSRRFRTGKCRVQRVIRPLRPITARSHPRSHRPARRTPGIIDPTAHRRSTTGTHDGGQGKVGSDPRQSDDWRPGTCSSVTPAASGRSRLIFPAEGWKAAPQGRAQTAAAAVLRIALAARTAAEPNLLADESTSASHWSRRHPFTARPE